MIKNAHVTQMHTKNLMIFCPGSSLNSIMSWQLASHLSLHAALVLDPKGHLKVTQPSHEVLISPAINP